MPDITRLNSEHKPFSRIIGWLILPLLYLPAGEAAGADINVFILHSYHQEYPWTAQENKGIVSGLGELFPGRDLGVSTEYLDTKRVSFTEAYQLFFKDYLEKKYTGFLPDIVFVTDDNALNFMMRFKEAIFPGVPVVFCGVNNLEVAKTIHDDNVYGVFEMQDIAGNLHLIKRLFPEVTEVTFIGDNSETYQAIHRQILAAAEDRFPDYVFEFIAHNNLSKINSQLKHKQPEVVVLTTIGKIHDQRGQPVSIKTFIGDLRKSGDFAILCMENVYLQHGVFGGIVTSGIEHGRTAARLARYVMLNTKQAAKRFVSGPNIPVFDYTELERIGVEKSRLPEHSVILNEPLSFYEEFREIFFVVVITFAILTALILSLVLSIVKRKKVESDLEANKYFLNSVLDNLPDMVFVKDARDLRFIQLNRVGQKYFGTSLHEILGKNDYDFFPKDEADFFTLKDRETLLNKTLVDIPFETIQTKNGRRYLHTKKIPILDKEMNPVYLLGISRDITEERQAAQARNELEEKLKQSQKMESIGTLAGGIAHDFNNILSSIIGYTELAQRQAEEPEAVKKLLDGTLKGAERAKQLVRQILTFSRKNEKRQELVVLADVVHEGLELLRSTLPSTISIEEEIVSRGRIIADPTQIHQVMMNLGTNGYHAMQDKGGTLRILVDSTQIHGTDDVIVPGMERGNYVVLEISDTGKGMDNDTVQRMFDPYFSTKGPELGTGLGLAVVHGIIKNHGGYIHVESAVSEGTTIAVYLPAVHGEHFGDKKEVQPVLELQGRNELILFVDDEPDILALSESLLRKSGYQVDIFNNGADAVTAYSRNSTQYDLIITDMTMPGMTGIEMAEKLLRDNPKIPIILCTGHSDSIDKERALTMGIRAYLEKPVTINELLLAIREVLDTQ